MGGDALSGGAVLLIGAASSERVAVLRRAAPSVLAAWLIGVMPSKVNRGSAIKMGGAIATDSAVNIGSAVDQLRWVALTSLTLGGIVKRGGVVCRGGAVKRGGPIETGSVVKKGHVVKRGGPTWKSRRSWSFAP